MDRVADILNNIKDRLSNPLIFSFIVSWLIYNWQISVALIWYDTKEVHAEGCNSLFEFIQDKLNQRCSWGWPLFTAIIYTISMPIIKGGIRLFNSHVFKHIDKLDLEIIKNGSVSVEKYLKYREQYINRTNELDNIIKSENKYLDENNKLREEIFSTRENVNRSLATIEELNRQIDNIDNYSFLNGFWRCTYTTQNNSNSYTEEVEINNHKFQIVSENRVVPKYSIRNFFLNQRTLKVFFIKELEKDYIRNHLTEDQRNEITYGDQFTFVSLRIDNEDRLLGHENDYVEVVYERISNRTVEKKNKE